MGSTVLCHPYRWRGTKKGKRTVGAKSICATAPFERRRNLDPESKTQSLHGAFQVLRIIDSPRSRCQGGVFLQWPHATVLAYVFISSANAAYCTMSVSKLVSCCTDTMPISIDWCFSRDYIQHTRIHLI
jgi:hypothetical protein